MTTEPMDQKTAERILALVETIEGRLRQVDADLADLRRLATAQPTTASEVRRLFEAFSAGWKRRYGASYQFTGARDGAQFKRLLRSSTVVVLEAAIDHYLASDDRFLCENKHPLALFIGTVNRWTVVGDAYDVEGRPVGCRHSPTCRTDAEHTRKMIAERRAAS